ncbi:MAG: ABC transporter permease [Bacillota bacterium]|nr:ABC transporter permease [Bacillota bacterium]
MKNIAKAVLVFFVTLGLWAFLAILYQHPTLPAPWTVIANIAAVDSQKLWLNIAASAVRVGSASLLALALGVPIGILTGYSRRWSKLLSPLIYFSYPVPKLALLPVLMLLFGLGEISKVLMIFLIIFFPIVMDITAAVRSMDRSIFETLGSYGLGSGAICLRVVLPGIVPATLNSLKVTTGIALSVLFFAENYGTTAGMGYYIMNSWQKMDYVDLYSGIFILSILGFLVFCLIDLAERRLTKWK